MPFHIFLMFKGTKIAMALRTGSGSGAPSGRKGTPCEASLTKAKQSQVRSASLDLTDNNNSDN